MGHDQKYVDKKYEVVGERFNRPDGIDKVTGKARYGADASAPGQLVGRVLRSPHAHAQILKINTAKAEKLPGVKSVVTFEDMPDLTGGDQGWPISWKTVWREAVRCTTAMLLQRLLRWMSKRLRKH